MQERLDQLSAEIAHINRYVAKLRCSSSSMQGDEHEEMLLDEVFPNLSNTQNDSIPALSEESWDDDDISKKFGNGLVITPKCYNVHGNPKGDHANCSLGSCGSLADSEGSVSPVNRVPCCIVVVDHDEDMKLSKDARFYEDDVFLS